MSSAKSARVSERKRRKNAPLRTRAKTLITKSNRLIADKDIENAEITVKDAVIALDKAAQKGAIHKNNAARRKSRVVNKLNKAKADLGN
ncbi:MAG: 30S ribosomal protein S20 [Chloroflexi bacterium]|nr:30S ribosomal protein S20 [Chloroflexota bacterium]